MKSNGIGNNMADRNGTYIAFHADGQIDPSQSDMYYYRLLTAWNEHKSIDFGFTNSHEKASAVRDTSKATTLAQSLQERLRNSKNLLLLIGRTTKNDTDWIPFEIGHAIQTYKIPIIAVYTEFDQPIYNPQIFRDWWPPTLLRGIDNQTAHVIHVPFKKAPIFDAIGQFSHESFPLNGGLGFYSEVAYRTFGM
jgi:MTH538 TIR-like domain (DUF1863)